MKMENIDSTGSSPARQQ